MATVTLVPSAIFPLHTVLIMKTKLEQRIKAEIQAKNFKQWILKRILKTILWRHYYSIKGLEKVILKDFQHNTGNLHPMSHKWSPHSALSIVESMYKLRRRFVFGIWTCTKLKKFFRVQDVRSVTFPQDECTWSWTSKNPKVVLKRWQEEATWKE